MFKRFSIAAALALIGTAAVTPVQAQGQLNMLCAPQADWCEAIAAAFQRDTGIKVSMIRKSTGEILAQVRAEAQNPKTDIWYGGAADLHFVAAEEKLLEPYTSARMKELHPWAQKVHEQSKGHCVGVSTGAIALVYNKEFIAKKNLPVPKTWLDLTKPEYKGEVQLPNPNSSGTAYTIIAGLVQLWGEDQAFDYLKKLHANVNAYTRSGAAPVRAVARGETGLAATFNMEAITEMQAGFPIEIIYPSEGTSYEVACLSIIKGTRNLANAKKFYDWYLTPAAMDIGPKTNQWHVPAHPGATPDPRIPDITKIKLVDYDFAKYGASAVRKRILERWDREVGSLPR